MPRNVEVKAMTPDLSLVRSRLREMSCRDQYELRQTDTFFNALRGRLKLREFDDGSAELIFYERADQSGAKLSNYERVPCGNPMAIRQALAKALGVRGVIKKHREVTLIGRARVHLDQVEGLGSFVELEVVLEDGEPVSIGESIAERLLQELNIPRSALVSGAYIDLLEVHDCFSITELIVMEDLGLSAPGDAPKDILDGVYDRDGAVPCQVDGGLKCFGHPIGASGLRMAYEIYLQLLGRAGDRQLESRDNDLPL